MPKMDGMRLDHSVSVLPKAFHSNEDTMRIAVLVAGEVKGRRDTKSDKGNNKEPC